MVICMSRRNLLGRFSCSRQVQVNFNDEAAAKDLWAQAEDWCSSGATADPTANTSADSSPVNDLRCETICTGPLEEVELDCGGDDNDSAVAFKKAKRQAQNRVASVSLRLSLLCSFLTVSRTFRQQAFRARKEKLVRSLSSELANLQCQYSSTKAENERLASSLRLAQTELFAIRSVLQRPRASLIAEEAATPQCSVAMEPSSCTLTLKIDLESLLSQSREEGKGTRSPPFASSPSSNAEDGCVDFGQGPTCEARWYR